MDTRSLFGFPTFVTRYVDKEKKPTSLHGQEVETTMKVIITWYCPRCKLKNVQDRAENNRPRTVMKCGKCDLRVIRDNDRWIVDERPRTR